MAGKKGFAAVAKLRQRTAGATRRHRQAGAALRAERARRAGGLVGERGWNPLRARNYAEGTLEERFFSLKFFLAWAAERDVTRASEVTRPILEAYQRWLSRYDRSRAENRSAGARSASASAA